MQGHFNFTWGQSSISWMEPEGTEQSDSQEGE